MKRKPSVLSLMSVALLGAVLVASSCKKGVENPNGDGGERSTSATIIIPSNPTLSGVLGTGHNIKDTIRLTRSGAWRLSGLVYVDSADVLMIDPGTTIKGILSPDTTIPGGGLVICRGAKILAPGKCDSAIVFTSAATTPKSGDWSGVIILGNAQSNHAGRVQVEGVPSNPPASATFGGRTAVTGTNDADNSGILSYVRIEYAGFALSLNNEINGLTLAGVGSGTQIDHICVYKANDDAFEWFGGTVNCSYLVATDALDDMFDTDNGYRGTIQYALGLADTTRADQSQSNGIEADNNAAGDGSLPISHPIFKNLTLVGLPANSPKLLSSTLPPSGTGRYGRGAHFRRNTDLEISCSVVLGWNWGLSLDGALGTTPAKYASNHATWVHNVVSQGHNASGTPALISRYITESNGNPVTAANFFITNPAAFYDLAIADGNVAAATTGAVGLTNPFSRTALSNFSAVPGTSAATVACSGALGGSNWNSTCTPLWYRLQ